MDVAGINGTGRALASPGLRGLLRTMQRRCERSGWSITSGEWDGHRLTVEIKRGPLTEPDRMIRVTGTAQKATIERFMLGSKTEPRGRRGDRFIAVVRTTTFLGRTSGTMREVLATAGHYVVDNRPALLLESRVNPPIEALCDER